MPKRDVADFASALTEVIHREPAPGFSILLLDLYAHSIEQGAAGFDQHGIRGIERIGVDKIIDEGATRLLRVELGMVARWRRIDDKNDTSFGKEPIEGCA